MRRLNSLILLAALVFALVLWQQRPPAAPAASRPASAIAAAPLPSFLPNEAGATLDRIARGGPFGYRQDGVTFGNYEGLLPQQPRGYYHEYTVETPGAHARGPRRIITGGSPPVVYYYTGDHYRSFRRFVLNR
ncbi:ribonuclease domain-containing protein [Rhodanobacter umsongensis]|uniref:Ribonuclease domain-containing protein n=1 Tax=Rhodanobacter umsongensis TaxID=633153 RepID=A0ABW0JNM3_9GAMM